MFDTCISATQPCTAGAFAVVPILTLYQSSLSPQEATSQAASAESAVATCYIQDDLQVWIKQKIVRHRLAFCAGLQSMHTANMQALQNFNSCKELAQSVFERMSGVDLLYNALHFQCNLIQQMLPKTP